MALVRIGVSEEPREEALGSSETSVLTRATQRNIPEETILAVYVFRNIFISLL
jgi:hypothetical protein